MESEEWYKYQPETITESKEATILLDFFLSKQIEK